MPDPIQLALTYGSVREGRFCDTLVHWAAHRIARDRQFALDIIDPRADDAASVRRRIGAADAFVIVTPEYNHSYPAALKALIDGLYAEWQAKPVAFISYGGISGGLRAVEHLRGVFAELHAVGIRDSVSFANASEQFDGEGRLRHPERFERAMAAMLAHLGWWARALRAARAANAYAEIAA
jgi:NAD(P)H-dependent FMN reductase